jgi:hypothetical protein
VYLKYGTVSSLAYFQIQAKCENKAFLFAETDNSAISSRGIISHPRNILPPELVKYKQRTETRMRGAAAGKRRLNTWQKIWQKY